MIPNQGSGVHFGAMSWSQGCTQLTQFLDLYTYFKSMHGPHFEEMSPWCRSSSLKTIHVLKKTDNKIIKYIKRSVTPSKNS